MEETIERNVNHPSHYTGHKSGVETIDITRWLPFDLGNAWKYLMRYNMKNAAKQDVLKACWYLNDYANNRVAPIVPQCDVETLLNNMDTVISSEESEKIQGGLSLIRTICKFPMEHVSDDEISDVIKSLTEYANTLG